MADTKLSELTLLASGGLADADEFYVNDGGVSKRLLASSLSRYAGERLGLVNVLDHGATGDGVTDDATAIQAAIDATPVGGVVFFPVPSGGSYVINTGLTCPGTKGLEFAQGVGINTDWSDIGDTPALDYDGSNIANPQAYAHLGIRGYPNITGATSGSAGFGNCALRLRNIAHKVIQIGFVDQFYSGVLYQSDDSGTNGGFVGYNDVHTGSLFSCVYNHDVWCTHSTSGNSWFNSNKVRSARLNWFATGSGERAALRMRRNPLTVTDDNIQANDFWFGTYEGTIGSTEPKICKFEAGSENRVRCQHVEPSGVIGIHATGYRGISTFNRLYVSGSNPPVNTPVKRDQAFIGTHDGAGNAAVLSDSTADFGEDDELVGGTVSNITDGSSVTITANTATTVTGVLSGGTDNDWDASDEYIIAPPNSARWNVVVPEQYEGQAPTSISLPNFADIMYESDGSGAAAAEGWQAFGNRALATGVVRVRASGNNHQDRYIAFDNLDGMGFYIDTTVHKDFLFSGELISTTGRVMIHAFDSDGAKLDPFGSTQTERYNGTLIDGAATTAGTDGGAWVGTPGDDFVDITVKDEVKSIRVTWTGGGTIADGWKNVSVSLPAGAAVLGPLRIWSEFGTFSSAPKVSASPTLFGFYPLGWSAALTGGTGHVVCTTAGTRTQVWAITTAYAVNDLVENDTGKIYRCTVAGTSAGSGGPTGTGTGITDNTVTWDYYGVEAAFTTI